MRFQDLNTKKICINKCVKCGYMLWWEPLGDATTCVHCPRCETHHQFYKNEDISYHPAPLDYCKELENRKVWNSHDWNPLQTECPTCLKCGLSPISAHLWGDDEWTADPILCPGWVADVMEREFTQEIEGKRRTQK